MGWKSFLLVCLLHPAIAVSAPQVLKEKPRLQQAGLFLYLNTKCREHIGALETRTIFYRPAFSARCVGATTKFIGLLDMPIKDHVSRTVVFKKDLIIVLNDVRTETILREILRNSDLLKLGIQQETIFSLVKRWMGSDEAAVYFVATLFQDTTTSAYQLEYASQTPPNLRSSSFETNLELTQQIVERLQHQAKLALSFYPDYIRNITTDPNFYHFFVIARLSYLMKQARYETPESFLIPFMMNYAYEALDEPKQVINTMRDDVAFRSNSNLDDVMLGYYGALWGSGRPSNFVNESNFRRIMSDNSRWGSSLREILNATRF